jgi:hypothetical protein
MNKLTAKEKLLKQTHDEIQLEKVDQKISLQEQ